MRPGPATLVDRCSRLVRFLYDLALSQSEQVLDVDAYPAKLWLCDLPDQLVPDVTAGPGDVLLRVRPVASEPPPDLPDLLGGWVSLSDRDNSALEAPPLLPRGPRRIVPGASDLPPQEVNPGQHGNRWDAGLPEETAAIVGGMVDVAGAPEVVRAYEAWLPSWRAWAERDRLTARQRRVYDELYTAAQRLSQEGDTLELVLGTGLLLLQGPDARRVRHPLLTTRVHASVDRATSAMVVRLPDDALTRLEDAALLRGNPEFHAERTNPLHERLRDREACPLGEDDQALLAEWLERGLATTEGFAAGWRPPAPAHVSVYGHGDRPQVFFAPVLLLRPRGRGPLLNYYDEMLRALRTDGRPPLGLAQLVETLEPAQRLEWLAEQGATPGDLLGADPLFPLPANPEQAQIMDRLRADNGVVVEGPPGTGKTHTIANLICALLAQGQRVLVTSQKAQALRVLRDKLPDDMRRLCVSLTDVSRGGSPELAGSIAALAAEKAAHNPRLRAERIERARNLREQALARRATLTEQIRALREAETFIHPEIAPGFSGTLAAIAARLRDQADEHAWMPVPVPATGEPPLSEPAALELLGLLRGRTAARAARVRQHLPDVAGFPSAREFRVRVEAERDAARSDAASRSAVSAALDGLDAAAVADLESALDTLDAATARLAERVTDSDDRAWSDRALADGFAHRDESLWQALAQAGPQVERVELALRGVALRGVTLPDLSIGGASGSGGADGAGGAQALLVAARNLRSYLAGGGRLRRAFRPQVQKDAEPILTGATVDGVAVTCVDQLDVVVAHLEATVLSGLLAQRWALVGVTVDTGSHTGTPSSVRLARLHDLHRILDLVFAVVAARDGVAHLLAARRVRDVQLRTLDDCDVLGDALASVRLRLAAQEATAGLDRLSAMLRVQARAGDAPPELAELTDAVHARDPTRYADRLAALAGAHAEQAAERRYAELEGRLHEAHPRLAALLARTCDDPAWEVRLTRLPAAWAWGRARVFFDAQRDPDRPARLESELAAAEQALAMATATLATEQAWQHCLDRMNAAQVAALQSYRAAIDARGKGLGRHAAHFNRAARDAMRDAQGAVPAWIMPLPDVLSTIPPVRDSFDVVIVDEASQASLESLFLLWLAPRVIVVGDDRQCTPPEVALGALDPIFERLDELLDDLPSYLRVSFTPRSSLFAILRSRFGQVIRLREHFRCMPEIIEWSSSMFYRDAPLAPLRQFGSDRLEPLRTVHVPGAFNEGKHATLRNQVEAEALVSQLLRCAADPAYEGRTFGVIVLQGSAQADVIRNALLRRMSRQEQEDRRLRIGTPPDFQGDERQVVFLSMVLAPGTRTTSLTKLEYQRRFNVAASRAQDQVWLFHSVTADALNPSDLRHSYLTYLQTRPHVPVHDTLGAVRRDVPCPPFESLFEQRVFLDIRARGYAVTPQVEVNGRRIDLVVTGGAAKLAVECDGDAWHSSPEQIEADLARERELKRAGWRFWRVRESEYTFDPGGALAGLWPTLDALGIRPFAPVPADGPVVPPPRGWAPIALTGEEGLDDQLDDQVEAH